MPVNPTPSEITDWLGLSGRICVITGAGGNLTKATFREALFKQKDFDAAGMAGGIEIAQRAAEITGIPLLFCAGMTGQYGAVMWVSGGPDLATVESAGDALVADPSWLALVDRVAPSYAVAASSTLYQRIV